MEIINIKDDVDEVQVQENLTVQNYGDGFSWTRGRLLGRGGFGSVFLATLKNSGSVKMAVKSAEIPNSDSLQHERKVLNSLIGCPYVIQCHGSEITRGVDGSGVYNLLLDYGSGGSLVDRIFKSGSGRGLPEYEARWYTRSMVKGLVKIHQAGYVHCDMKPDNVLLVPRNRKGAAAGGGGQEFTAKICDFGLAKGVKEDRRKRKLQRAWRGTPMYLPPEAVREGLQEPASDIWSLGCIVLEMLTGSPAWDVEEKVPASPERIFRKLTKGVAVPKIPKGLSPEARSFLKCCLRRMVKNRAEAKTLLYHPFVNGFKEEDVDEDVNNGVRQAEKDGSSELIPQLLMRRNCLIRGNLQSKPQKILPQLDLA